MSLVLWIKLGYTLSLMPDRTHKFLLIFIVLALAIAPLRGVLAAPVPAAADDPSHCEQVQTGMQASGHVAGTQDTTADTRDHDCDQGCGGDCCDGACNDCAHASIALSGIHSVTPDNLYISQTVFVSYGVSDRTVHPPFRPPISLPG